MDGLAGEASLTGSCGGSGIGGALWPGENLVAPAQWAEVRALQKLNDFRQRHRRVSCGPVMPAVMAIGVDRLFDVSGGSHAALPEPEGAGIGGGDVTETPIADAASGL